VIQHKQGTITKEELLVQIKAIQKLKGFSFD